MARALSRQLPVQTADGPEKMAVTDVLLTALSKAGAQGNVSAIKLMFDLAKELDVGLEQPDARLSADDEVDFELLVAALRPK